MTDSDPDRRAANQAEPPPGSPSFWSFVPIGDYRFPSLPASGAIADAWASAKRLLRRVDQSSLLPARDEATLRALPEGRLEHLAPPIDPAEPADALDAALYRWLQADASAQPVRYVVAQPHAHPGLLRFWAARHGAAIIEPPSPRQILEGDVDWLAQWPVDGGTHRFWVLPDLARCYLRHAEGLSLVRVLLARADSGELGRGIIGCDSWAWAYLSHLWPVPHPEALAAQAFDGTRLTRLLTHQVERRPHRRVRFRNAMTGRDILAVPSTDTEEHPEIQRLAAHCRGNPGTALTYWRRSLRAEPHEDATVAIEEDHAVAGEIFDEEDVWVSARLDEPVPPNETEEDVALVLHALLLHDGLPLELLPELLPLTHDGCLAILLHLQRARLVEPYDDGRWRVMAMGYAGVRALLQGRDYLTDAF